MKRNKLSLFLVTIASGFLLCQNAGAYPIFTDEFANYLTGRLGDNGTGGGGGIPGWNTAIPSITVTNPSGSLDGTSLGLVVSFGDKVYIASTNNLNNGAYQRWGNSGDYNPQAAYTGATNIYFSFLYKFKDHADYPVSSVGQRIVQLNKQNSGYTSSSTITHWMVHARDVAGKIQLGISEQPGTAVTVVTNWAATNLNYEDTFFVVVRTKLTHPVNTSNEVQSLWINPVKKFFGTNEANVPLPDATVADGADDSSSTGLGRFFILSSGQQAEFDELRIANNWSDVTPWFGQCLLPYIALNPISVTNAEGIGANLSVTAYGTGAAFRWQLNQNGTSSWIDISGANDRLYTTPNLWLALDQGNQYRVIVTNTCGVNATSTVATVTLTAVSITPAGLIMYDNFSDGFRGAGPVTTNNSVWFTASAYTTDLDPGLSGPLVGTPVAGTSTLWLGYFMKETNGFPSTLVPVTLGVTNAIKVTLPFTTGTMGSFTTNGALRFGLFDYADGGVLFTQDVVAAGGSLGNGLNVRGYMLSVDFGKVFTANSPLSLSVRSGLSDQNLMGTTGDYLSMGSGPRGGGYSNAPAFQPNTAYTLVFQVTRTETNLCRVTTTISCATTNWSWSAVDTNGLDYHRFDAFGIRPNRLENAADTFSFPYFEVQVIPTAWECTAISGPTVARTGNNVALTWVPTPSPSIAAFTYSVQRNYDLLTTNWVVLSSGISVLNYTDTSSASAAYYRVTSP
jgi:hypothetical protein